MLSVVPPPPPAPAPAPCVLLVDDDADCLEIGRRALERAGFRVRCCFGVDEALAAAAEEPPDAVVTDLMMDTLDAGLVLARRLREDPRLGALPVVLTTAVEGRTGIDLSPRAPADLAAMRIDAYLPKPLAGPRLVALVRTLLARRVG